MKLSNEVRREIVITCKTNAMRNIIGKNIHEQLAGSRAYIENDIILNIDEDCTVRLTIMNTCPNDEIPTTIPM